MFSLSQGEVIDREKLQDTIQASLEKSIHEKIKLSNASGWPD
jgi:hypothetical protein